MAQMTVDKREANGYFPAVCMVCGEEATVTKTKAMSWCPAWVHLLILVAALPYIIVAMIMTKRAAVQGPFCDKHEWHWLKPQLLLWGSFFLFGAFIISSLSLASSLAPGNNILWGSLCAFSSLLGIVWLVLAIVYQHSTIRPAEITDDEITLAGVCDAFVAAAEESRAERRRRRREDDSRWDDDEPRRRRRGRDDDDDDDAPRRRKRSDAFEE